MLSSSLLPTSAFPLVVEGRLLQGLFSEPAQRSLALRPARSLNRLHDPFSPKASYGFVTSTDTQSCFRLNDQSPGGNRTHGTSKPFHDAHYQQTHYDRTKAKLREAGKRGKVVKPFLPPAASPLFYRLAEALAKTDLLARTWQRTLMLGALVSMMASRQGGPSCGENSWRRVSRSLRT